MRSNKEKYGQAHGDGIYSSNVDKSDLQCMMRRVLQIICVAFFKFLAVRSLPQLGEWRLCREPGL